MEKAVITSLVQIYLGLSRTNEKPWQPHPIAVSAHNPLDDKRPRPPLVDTGTPLSNTIVALILHL